MIGASSNKFVIDRFSTILNRSTINMPFTYLRI